MNTLAHCVEGCHLKRGHKWLSHLIQDGSTRDELAVGVVYVGLVHLIRHQQ